MKRFKIHKTDVKDYLLTKENFKDITQEQKPYVQYFPDKKNGFALCPYCENPIVIVGLYRKVENKPDDFIYGRHYAKDVPNIGKHLEYTYINCKYAKKAYNVCPKEIRTRHMTTHAMNIYNVMHDYYDKIIYVLQESIGYKISLSMAERLIKDYVYSEGYLYPPSTVNNSPWMLMYIAGYSINPWKKYIKVNSELYNALSKIDTVRFETIPTNEEDPEWKRKEVEKYRILTTTKYTQISILFLSYHRIKRNDEMVEIMTMTVSCRYHDNNEWKRAATIDIEIDDNYLQNIIQSDKWMKRRNEKLLKIVDENMPNLTHEHKKR